MVKIQLLDRGIQDSRVLDAMRTVPRQLFVSNGLEKYAYEDAAFPIGYDQTISQPFVVAFMTESARLMPDARVLEIGTGSGYQAAILSVLCKEVYTTEVIYELAIEAQKRLTRLAYNNVHVRIGSGRTGWPERAPFDAIIATAAAPVLPVDLVAQLKMGGRLIVPVGTATQELVRLTRHQDGVKTEHLLPVRFVPMVE